MKAIIKYQNRKLYDKGTSRYITLKDVFEMVKADANFLVVHNTTKMDITRETVQEALNQYVKLELDVARSLIKTESRENV